MPAMLPEVWSSMVGNSAVSGGPSRVKTIEGRFESRKGKMEELGRKRTKYKTNHVVELRSESSKQKQQLNMKDSYSTGSCRLCQPRPYQLGFRSL